MSLQGPGSQNDPGSFADLAAKIRSLSERIADLERGSQLRPAGISVSPEGMTIDSSLTVNGDTDITGDLTTSGNTVIGGNASITGTLSLPAGIIDNDALANPVSFDSDRDGTSGFGVTTSEVSFTSSSCTVPAGFTDAHVTAIASCGVGNGTGSTQYIYCRVRVDSPATGAFQYSGAQMITLPAGFFGSLIVPMMWATTGMAGGNTVVATALLSASATIASHPSNWVDTEITVTWSR